MIERIVLIGNYKPDKQFSMLIFEELMAEGYGTLNIKVCILRPKEIVRKTGLYMQKAQKWLAYIDKFILFPFKILWVRSLNFLLFRQVLYHICDHSNAFYIYFLPKNNTLITCHDVLAIRAGLGFTDTYCTATKSGVVLQKIILNALSSAKKLAAVSRFTLNQLQEIDMKPDQPKKWVCIHNALAEKFKPLPMELVKQFLGKFHLAQDKNFILHVGSDLERKNRKLLILMMHELKNDWDGFLVCAGEKFNAELQELIKKLDVVDRIVHLSNPSNDEIVALYSSCQAMVFPSYSEGFGWPIIEAQACGAPVITSNKPPMMDEVGGKSTLYADPDNAASFAKQFLKLEDEQFRDEIIRLGFENAKRFNFENTVELYVELINR